MLDSKLLIARQAAISTGQLRANAINRFANRADRADSGEHGMMRLHRESCSVSELVEGVVEIYRLIAEEKKIEIITDLQDPSFADVDPNRMRQALANLIDNAVKYTPEGGHVTVTCLQSEQSVEVSIKDDGMGIPPREQPRIWERLYRGDKSRAQRGLGLGLSLVKAVIEAHGGRVTVQSSPGAGSEFTVRLPVGARVKTVAVA